MSKPHEQLEQELQAIWQRAANTRKTSSPSRVEHILRCSRAELSMRDLLTFSGYLLAAFFQLLGAVLSSLTSTHHKSYSTVEKKDHE